MNQMEINLYFTIYLEKTVFQNPYKMTMERQQYSRNNVSGMG